MSETGLKKPTAYDKRSVDSRLGPNVHDGEHPEHKNVLDTPLIQHSTRSSIPMASRSLPSHMKAGFCDAESPIAAQLTQSFLDFTSKNGVNLKQLGIRPGQKWCLAVDHWKEAAERDAGGDAVPRVSLESTHQAALEKVDLEMLKKYEGVGSAKYAYQWGGKE